MASIKLSRLRSPCLSNRKRRLSLRSPTEFLPAIPGWHDRHGKNEEVEFEKTYKLETTIVPTNRVRARQDWADQVFKTEAAKWRAVANETAEIIRKAGLLVGTTSVEKSELLSSLLASGDPHNLLNVSLRVEVDQVVAQAGQAGAVTIATNMAGRGTDIILGSSDYMARLKLREVLLGRLVKPEDDHKQSVSLQLSAPGGFADAADLRTPQRWPLSLLPH